MSGRGDERLSDEADQSGASAQGVDQAPVSCRGAREAPPIRHYRPARRRGSLCSKRHRSSPAPGATQRSPANWWRCSWNPPPIRWRASARRSALAGDPEAVRRLAHGLKGAAATTSAHAIAAAAADLERAAGLSTAAEWTTRLCRRSRLARSMNGAAPVGAPQKKAVQRGSSSILA